MEYGLIQNAYPQGTITTGSTNVSSGWSNSTSCVTIPSCSPKENSMKLYKVFLVRIDTREVIEVNVAARDQVDAFLKAFLAKQISEVDQYDKHAQFICDLTEEDD